MANKLRSHGRSRFLVVLLPIIALYACATGIGTRGVPAPGMTLNQITTEGQVYNASNKSFYLEGDYIIWSGKEYKGHAVSVFDPETGLGLQFFDGGAQSSIAYSLLYLSPKEITQLPLYAAAEKAADRRWRSEQNYWNSAGIDNEALHKIYASLRGDAASGRPYNRAGDWSTGLDKKNTAKELLAYLRKGINERRALFQTELNFNEAFIYYLNHKLLQGNSRDEVLDKYLRSTSYAGYKARLETKHGLDEYKNNSYHTLTSQYRPDLKYYVYGQIKVGAYDTANNGFKVYLARIEKNLDVVQNQASSGTGVIILTNESSDIGNDNVFTAARINIDINKYLLPVAPEQATDFLTQDKGKRSIIPVVFVFKLSDCDENGSAIKCNAKDVEGYVFESKHTYNSYNFEIQIRNADITSPPINKLVRISQ